MCFNTKSEQEQLLCVFLSRCWCRHHQERDDDGDTAKINGCITKSSALHFSTMPQLKTSKEILDKKYKNFFSWRQFMGLARSFRSLHAFETESYAFLLFFKSCIALYIFFFWFSVFLLLHHSPLLISNDYVAISDKKHLCRFFPLALFSQQW